MNEIITKEKINTSEIFEQYFNEKDLIFFKSKKKDIDVYLLPYRIKDKKIKVDINVIASKNKNLCRIGFKSKLNPNIDYREKLLDMNSKLDYGSLSVESGSDYVAFNINFKFFEDSNIETLYRNNLVRSISVFIDLVEDNIIEAETVDEK